MNGKEMPELATRNDFALVQLNDRSFIAASAPFAKSSEPAKDGISFYTNDFLLSDCTPWRIPNNWVRFNSLEELDLTSSSISGLQWVDPNYEDFRKIFKSIELDLEQGATDPLGAEAASCQFCLEEFASGEELLVLPCFHRFHAGCVERWLQDHATCPSCRSDLEENLGEQL